MTVTAAPVVIKVGDRSYPHGMDHLTCRQHIVGKGQCGEVVFLPGDGGVPSRCSRGHALPWFGTMEVT